MFHVAYRYCDADDLTETTLTFDESPDSHVVITPSLRDGYQMFVGLAVDGNVVWDLYLEPDALDALIAELQRARSGVLRGMYPRPVAPAVDEMTGDDEELDGLTVREFVHAIQARYPDDAVVLRPDAPFRILMPA